MIQRDQLWKSIIETFFEDFLMFFFPDDAEHLFDFSRGFVYLEQELSDILPPENGTHAMRYVDKLVKVYTRDGQEEYVLIHVEIQGYPDKDFAMRMFQYYIRLWDRYKKRITTVVIFTDEKRAYHPACYKTSYLGTHVRYDFNTYTVMDQSARALAESNNPFAQVVLTAQAFIKGQKLRGASLYKFNIALAKRLYAKDMDRQKVQNLMNFLRQYVHFENKGMINKFTEEIETITQKEKAAMGIMEYLNKTAADAAKEAAEKATKAAEAKNKMNFTKNLISLGQLSDQQIAEAAEVSVAFVRLMKKEAGA